MGELYNSMDMFPKIFINYKERKIKLLGETMVIKS